jgi:hypothetical protein
MDDLIGTWQLLSWILYDVEGEAHYPLGQDAEGFLSYHPSGFMSVHLARKNRPQFQSESIFSVSAEEALENHHSYASYCGRYEILPDRILHFVQMHSCPNWIGSIQERHFKIENDVLHFSHQLEANHSQLIWQKFKP